RGCGAQAIQHATLASTRSRRLRPRTKVAESRSHVRIFHLPVLPRSDRGTRRKRAEDLYAYRTALEGKIRIYRISRNHAETWGSIRTLCSRAPPSGTVMLSPLLG